MYSTQYFMSRSAPATVWNEENEENMHCSCSCYSVKWRKRILYTCTCFVYNVRNLIIHAHIFVPLFYIHLCLQFEEIYRLLACLVIFSVFHLCSILFWYCFVHFVAHLRFQMNDFSIFVIFSMLIHHEWWIEFESEVWTKNKLTNTVFVAKTFVNAQPGQRFLCYSKKIL